MVHMSQSLGQRAKQEGWGVDMKGQMKLLCTVAAWAEENGNCVLGLIQVKLVANRSVNHLTVQNKNTIFS